MPATHTLAFKHMIALNLTYKSVWLEQKQKQKQTPHRTGGQIVARTQRKHSRFFRRPNGVLLSLVCTQHGDTGQIKFC